jgi:hypothetical protein
MGIFLCTFENFPFELEPFVQSLTEEIGSRFKNLENNKVLQMATLLDPRYAYTEEFFSKAQWAFIEEDLVAFVKESNI